MDGHICILDVQLQQAGDCHCITVIQIIIIISITNKPNNNNNEPNIVIIISAWLVKLKCK